MFQSARTSKLIDETLDYEDYNPNDYDDERDEDSESNDSDSRDDSTESDFVESDLEVNKSHSVKSYVLNSSESEEDTHRRRSWKKQRNEHQNSSDSLDETKLNTNEDTTNDTIESPCYELIGQDSPIKNVRTHKELEIIAEESGSSTNEKEDLDNSSSIQKQVIQHQIEVNSIETSSTEDQNKEGCQKSSEVTDIFKLAEVKRKQFLETGSISDLKKRRSKRYKSLGNLTENSRKSRRRSSSLHDFTSLMIKESKSATATSRDFIENNEFYPSNSMSNDDPPCKSCFSGDLPSEVPEESDQRMECEDNTTIGHETNNMSRKASSLFGKINSAVSTRLSSCDDASFMTENTLNYSTRRGYSIKSRFSSLEDISEETSDRKSLDKSKAIRKSVSADNLVEHDQFEEIHPRQSSSVCRWSDYAKAQESENTLPEVSENEGFQDVNCKTSRKCISSYSNNCDHLNLNPKGGSENTKIQKNKSFSEEIVEQESWIHNECSSSSKTFDVQSVSSPIERSVSDSLNSSNMQDSNNRKTSKTSIKRNQRAKSESFVPEDPDKSRLPKKRRSSSLLKLQNIDKSVLSRYSLKRKSSKESLCAPLEVLYSDEECNDSSVRTQIQNKVGTKSISVDVNSKSTVYESLDKSAIKITELPGQGDITSLSGVGGENTKIQKSSSSSNTSTSKIDVPSARSPVDRSVSDSLNDSNNRNHSKTNIKRNQRAKSEPFVPEDPDKLCQPKKRRASSLLKLQNIDKSLLSRYSLKRKSSKESLCAPLEVLYSDEECDDGSVSIQMPNKVDKKSISVDMSSDKSSNKNLDLPGQNDLVSQRSSQIRKQRGESEPPRVLTDVIHEPSLRKSGSYKKVQNIHKLEISNSLRKLNHLKSYQPLEVIHSSDEEKSLHNKSSDSPPSSSTVKPDNDSHEKDVLTSKGSKKGRIVKKTKIQAEYQNKFEGSVHKQAASNEESDLGNLAIKIPRKKTKLKDNKEESKHLVSKSKGVQSSKTNTSTDFKNQSSLNEKDIDSENTLQHSETDNTLQSSNIDKETNNPDFPQPPKKRGRKLKTSSSVEQPVQSEEQGTRTNDENPVEVNKKVNKVPEDQASDELGTQKISKTVPKKQKASKTTSEAKGNDLSAEEAGSSKDVEVKANKGIVSKKQKTKRVVLEGEALPNQEETSDLNKDQIHPTTPVSKRNKKETTGKQKLKNAPSELALPMFDSPARRTRRSMSRLSDTELLTPTKDIAAPRRSARKSSAMSDIMVSTPTSTAYAESETSEASTNASFRLNTPLRRTRKLSLNTPLTVSKPSYSCFY